jgi:predicted permease
MTLLARFRSWLVACVRRADLERSMNDEMALHIELYEADLRRAGISDGEAHRRARAEFGSVEARKEECREALGLRLLNELRSDAVYAFRLLRRSPAFTAVALLSLGLGIGANTAIFSLVDTVLMKSLPIEDPQRLFFVDNSGGRSGGSSGPPYPCFEILRDNNRFLSGIAAFQEDRFKATIDGGVPEQMRGQYASGNYFQLLGVAAVHGRLLTPADDSVFDRGGPDGAAAVISYGAWKRRFSLDPGVLGKNIQVGTQWVTIVGVTPPEFFGLQVGSPIDITIPMMLAGRPLRSRELWWHSVVARLKPDATVEQARADLEGLWDAYMTDISKPRDNRGAYFTGLVLVPAARGLAGLRRTYSEPLLILMAIVAVVLLIGCANVANLLLGRASARQNEISVRLAIGAGRARLVRQLLTEGAVLIMLGTLGGLVFARWLVGFLLGLFANEGHGILLEPQFDSRVLGFTAAVATVTAIVFSLAPALRATRIDAAKPSAAGLSSSPSVRTRLSQSLIVVQVMLAVVLLCAAALFLRTLHNLNRVDTGFDRAGVLTMVVEATIPGRQLGRGEHRAAFAQVGTMWEDFITRVRALPGVRAAAVTFMSPLTGRDRGALIAVSGMTLPDEHRSIHINQVSAQLFETMGIPLLAGRLFTPSDRASSPRVAILNNTAAKTYFANVSPMGRKVSFPGQPVEDQYEIVGVVGDARYQTVRNPDERMVYLPIEQPIYPMTTAAVAVRGSGNIAGLVPSMRKTAAAALPGAFVTRVGTIDERLRQSLLRERLLSMLATFFGALALGLACIGLYGVMAYSVVRRTREIGIRIAIGARQRSVIWMILRETVGLVLFGAGLGTIMALFVSRYVKSQLFGVAPGDPLAVTIAILLLLTVTAAAAYLPARRASRIDPVVALRYE